METKKEVKPLQVRLPAEVYDALQYEATAKGMTMNAVVVECLRANLPHSSWIDHALVRDAGLFANAPGAHRENAQDTLEEYQGHVANEITIMGELTQLRMRQIGSAARVSKSLRKEWPVEGPADGPPRTTERGVDASFLYSLDTTNHRKAEEKVRDAIKALARARTEAYRTWQLFLKHVERMNQAPDA